MIVVCCYRHGPGVSAVRRQEQDCDGLQQQVQEGSSVRVPTIPRALVPSDGGRETAAAEGQEETEEI